MSSAPVKVAIRAERSAWERLGKVLIDLSEPFDSPAFQWATLKGTTETLAEFELHLARNCWARTGGVR